MILKPDVSNNDFEDIKNVVEGILIAIDPDVDGRLIANTVLPELGRRGYVVRKPPEKTA